MERKVGNCTATRDARLTRAKERNEPALERLAVSKRRGRRFFVLVAPRTGRTVIAESSRRTREGDCGAVSFFQRHLFVDVIAEATPPKDGPRTFPFVSARGHRKRLRGLTAGDEGVLRRLRRPVFHRVGFPLSFLFRPRQTAARGEEWDRERGEREDGEMFPRSRRGRTAGGRHANFRLSTGRGPETRDLGAAMCVRGVDVH